MAIKRMGYPKIVLTILMCAAAVTVVLAGGDESRAAYFSDSSESSWEDSVRYRADDCEARAEPDQEPQRTGGGPPSIPPPLDTDLPATRCITDSYPSFNGVAVDPEHDLVALSDTNRKSVMMFNVSEVRKAPEETIPARRIMGPKTQIGFVAGILLDSESREAITVNNDIEDTMMTFSYDADGNLTPSRLLAVPHQSWGIAIDHTQNQIAVTVQSLDAVVFYKRQANHVDAPVRSIIGRNTGLGDPHGLLIDEAHGEIAVASHGNRAEGDVSVGTLGDTTGGHFDSPSINTYAETAEGNASPLRTISGPRTRLNWPMGIGLDKSSDEIAVANNGDDSILFFKRTGIGDLAPTRIIRGARTGINNPMSVAIDAKNNEIWVANFGSHTAVAFDLNASGNATPKRIVRNAPAGTPTVGFGNPMALAYDTKRGEILVPNCVSQPRIAVFSRMANGSVAPKRVIAGQDTKLARTMHGIAYDPVNDEIVIPNPVAAAILVFRGGASGSEPPIRVIQGDRTKLAYPHSVNVDVKNREILVGDPGGRKILIFPLDANGDVAPTRVIQGPKTRLGYVVGIAVDAEHDLLVASSSSLDSSFEGASRHRGLLIFNRTDNGDVAPKAAISGPKTGMLEGPWQVQVDPERGQIFISVGNVISYRPRYAMDKLHDWAANAVIRSPWGSERLGFVGVWKITDDGDVPPSAVIKGPVSGIIHPSGMALDIKDREIFVTDSATNSTMTFYVPELFRENKRPSEKVRQ